MSTSDGSTAANILTAALGHMRERASTYDKPEGERSMGATVDAFLAVTGVSMTEEQGWLFMAMLKAVRSQQGAYRADSYEDGAAYFALAGEAAVRDRNGGWTDKAIKADALPRCGPMCATCHTIHGTQDRCQAIEPASAIDDDSERMQAIGQNGEMASEVYAAVDSDDQWKGAPRWAKYKAQDKGGEWCWFEQMPVALRDYWENYEEGGKFESACSGEENDLWAASLICR